MPQDADPRLDHLGFARWLAFLAALSALALLPAAAAAATPGPGWTVDSFAKPTSFAAADNAQCASTLGSRLPLCDAYQLTATNVGAQPTDAGPITLADTLPAGLKVEKISFFWSGSGEDLGAEDCDTVSVQCQFPGAVAPDQTLAMVVYVTVSESAPPGPITNTASVSGANAPPVSTSKQNQIDSSAPAFGVTNVNSFLAGLDGSADTRAAARPYELHVAVGFANRFRETPEGGFEATAIHDVRDVLIDLSPGLAGSALSAPTCPMSLLSAPQGSPHCPDDSIVGFLHSNAANSPLWNIAPEHGVLAEFGYLDTLRASHPLYVSLAPTPEGYVLRTTAPETPQVTLDQIAVDLYGDPAAHAGEREPQAGDVPTLTAPADCNGQPLLTNVYADSWQQPGPYNPDGSPNLVDPNWAQASSESAALTGCDELAGLFNPSLEASPETNRGDSPTGLDVTLEVPQREDATTLGVPPLRKAVATLPAGITVNPSAANGLEGCSLNQLGISAAGLPDAAAPHCPDASKLGTVELETPAISGVLQGQIYVAKQAENPFHSLLALYIVIDDPRTGVIVKIPAEVRADPQTGQLTTVVDNSPQFPFSELRMHFFGGQKAALRTPALCGTYRGTAQLTPWSAPESGPPATSSGNFKITQGCAASATDQPNRPSFSAGTRTPGAGLFSPFTLELARADGSQELSGLNLALPQGLLAKLAGVGECSDPQLALARSREHEGGGGEELASPSCPSSSEVGTVTVGAGAGLTPYYTSGHAYLAGPYRGAPLSLAVIIPAVAGPFDLGDVLVRVALQVNPETAQVSARSDPVPPLLRGIPLDLRSISLNLSRSGFTLNPTSCEKGAVSGEALSVFGQGAALFNSFQVGDCRGLGFKPRLSLRFAGSTERGAHPGFRAVLRAGGGEASVRRAAIALPATELLDNAHLRSIFPGARFAAGRCPAGSVYGHAKVWTPLLDRPLEGPVYLRSSKGKLPDLVASLDGRIHLDLVAHVSSAHGRLRIAFPALPDAPLSKLVLTMDSGKKGLLANTGGLCAASLRADASLLGYNGKRRYSEPVVKTDCGQERQRARAAI